MEATASRPRLLLHPRGMLAFAALLLMLPIYSLAAVHPVNSYGAQIIAAASCSNGGIIELRQDIIRESGQQTARIFAPGITLRSSEGSTFQITGGEGTPGRLLEGGAADVQAYGFTQKNVQRRGGLTTTG